MKKTAWCLGAVLLLAMMAAAMPPRPGLNITDPTTALSWIEKPNLSGLMTIETKDGLRITVSSLAKGIKKFPVLLIDYSDVTHPAAQTRAKFDSTLFVPHGIASGSLKDYYAEVSYGNFDLQGQCNGWYQADNGIGYYSNSAFGLNSSTYPKNAAGLVVEALRKADLAGVDFTQFSNSGGKLDLLIVIHAGEGAEGTGNPNMIWSHNGRLSGWPGVTTSARTVDGLLVDNYTIQPGTSSMAGHPMIEIGVVAHELGHGLGLPDLYDTDSDTSYANHSSGLGCFSLMAAGSWGGDYQHPQYPAHLDAWCKQFLGWTTPRNVAVKVRDSLAAAERFPQSLMLWPNGVPGQDYFLIENRMKTGFDTVLFDAGLLVYHIDQAIINYNLATNRINWKSHLHYGVALEEANHNNDLFNGINFGDASDAFAAGNSFGPPYSNTNNNQITNVRIDNISATGAVMWADYATGSDFNISLLQNPAFTYSLGISVVSNYRLLTPAALDTATIRWGYDPAQPLAFSHPTARTYQASYTLQEAGSYTIRIASRDSDSVAVYRSGDRSFSVTAAKAAGGTMTALNGAVSMQLSPGAIAGDMLWLVCQNEGISAAGAVAPACQVGPDAYPLGNRAELSLRYDAAALGGRGPGQLGIWQYANGQWEYLGGRLDAAGQRVSAVITKLGVFQLCWSDRYPALPAITRLIAPSASPNPFAAITVINFQLAAPGRTALKVYNVAGQLVRTLCDRTESLGAHAVRWDGTNDDGRRLPSGVYYYRLQAAGQTTTGRMVKVQ